MIVVVYAAFGLTVSEAKTDIMCLREGDAEVHHHIQRRSSGPGVQRVCSGWFAVEQGLRQECVLAPLLFNIVFAAVIKVVCTRFKADKGIMGASIHLRKKRGAGGRGEATTESQSWRCRFGACFMLTMPESSRNHPSR